ncbi:phosphatidylinositol 3-kinase regulatory subunit alpha-like isoform X1 [Mercenaria mercenaria]|uniref:phosphatidylinositol 3-kinase regulatory subunit alpha-like isoform X1 n=1 Tax=Mercenaria mercenaria TaxID=6596 RepID=UPI00234F082F|nr:phosphatidylinositol 3-kinase regulatory subunit alpha-like isoform X1 [Mercenaria mercenaria]
MRDSGYDTAWDWGESSRDYVDKFLEGEKNGTFLVYHTGDCENLTLAIRTNGENQFVKIYHLDNLYGFAEPLNFDSLEDALDAYNWSPTETGNTLIYPGIKPNSPLRRTSSRSSRSSLHEATPLTLLKTLRCAADLKIDNGKRYDGMQEENKSLEMKLLELNNSIDSTNCLIRIVEAQIGKQQEVFNRSSISSKEASNAFSTNYQNLTSRSSELSQEKRQVMEARSSIQQEKIKVEKNQASLYTELQQIVKEINAIRRELLKRKPDLEAFLECLLDENLRTTPEIKTLRIDKSAAENILNGSADGTFLVRTSKDPDKPYIISVCYMSKVYHFPVLQQEERFGLEEDTCIFVSIHELVNQYTKVCFSIHDAKYGTLKLQQQQTQRQ